MADRREETKTFRQPESRLAPYEKNSAPLGSVKRTASPIPFKSSWETIRRADATARNRLAGTARLGVFVNVCWGVGVGLRIKANQP